MTVKLYHVVVVNIETGKETFMTSTPVTHKEGCILLGKLSKYKWRKEMLKEVDKLKDKH